MAQEKFPISVIIPVYNGGNFLRQCLDALYSSDHPNFEVIVVNDGSTDGSEAISLSSGATVLSTERPRSGPAAARNLAAERARGDILVFVDADVVVKPDTISKIAQAFERKPEFAALFGSYDDSPGEQNFLSQYKNLQHHFVHQTSSPEASTFWAGLGAVRRDIFLAVGGFDCERFAVPSIEDIEFGTRLRAAGHRILLDRDIQAKHLKRWEAFSHVRTEVFCRAMPWSKLIVTSQGLINDMNLKTSDRASACFVALSILLVPLSFWQPAMVLLLAGSLIAILLLNLRIFRFYASRKGLLFAALTYPWQFFYFFYSGAVFGYCWLRYALPAAIGFNRSEPRSSAGEFERKGIGA